LEKVVFTRAPMPPKYSVYACLLKSVIDCATIARLAATYGEIREDMGTYGKYHPAWWSLHRFPLPGIDYIHM